MKKISLIAIVIITFITITSVSVLAGKKDYEMCCYSVGSLEYVWSAQHCKLVNKYSKTMRVTPAFCGAETASVKMLGLGRTDFAEVSHLELELAKRGMDRFQKYGKKSKEMFYDKIAIVYSMPYGAGYFTALADSPMKDLSDVKGKKVSLASAACTLVTICREVLDVHGLKEGDDYTAVHFSCGSGHAPEALSDRTIDMFECNNPGRQPSIENLATMNEIKRIPFAPGKLDAFFAHMDKKYGEGNHGLYRVTLPADLYGKNDKTGKEIETFAYDLMIATRIDMPEDVVYEYTKVLFDNMNEFYEIGAYSDLIKPEKAVKNLKAGIPLHPGAAKYYYEKGLLPKDRYKDLPESIRPK